MTPVRLEPAAPWSPVKHSTTEPLRSLIWVKNVCKKSNQSIQADERVDNICGSTRENLSSGIFEQQRCRPAWACAQSDQHLNFLLIGKYHIKTCFEQNFTILANLNKLKRLVLVSVCWKSRRQVLSGRSQYVSVCWKP